MDLGEQNIESIDFLLGRYKGYYENKGERDEERRL
jgi:hypothetical protein